METNEPTSNCYSQFKEELWRFLSKFDKKSLKSWSITHHSKLPEGDISTRLDPIESLDYVTTITLRY